MSRRGDVFHSTKNSGLDFSKFSVVNGTAVTGIFGKEEQPHKVQPIFENFWSGILVPFPEFSVEWLAFGKFNNFWVFRKPSNAISVPLASIESSGIFGWTESAWGLVLTGKGNYVGCQTYLDTVRSCNILSSLRMLLMHMRYWKPAYKKQLENRLW